MTKTASRLNVSARAGRAASLAPVLPPTAPRQRRHAYYPVPQERPDVRSSRGVTSGCGSSNFVLHGKVR